VDLSIVLPVLLLLIWFWHSQRETTSIITQGILTDLELEQLKSCFAADIYGLRSLDRESNRIVCYGSMRQENLRVAYKSVIAKVADKFGDRFLVLLRQMRYKKEVEGEVKPTFILVKNPGSVDLFFKSQASHLLLSFLSIVCSVYFLVNLPTVYVLCLVGLIVGRELIRYLVSRRCFLHLSLPIFLPGELGSFGSLSWNLVPFPHRRALFDLAIAPTIFSILGSLLLINLGMNDGSAGSTDRAYIPQISSWGWNFLQQHFNLVTENLLILAGKTGLLISALGILPIQPLAGGNLIQGMFGKEKAELVSKIMRLVLLAIALTQTWLLLFVFYLFVSNPTTVYVLDEVSEYGNWRDAIGLLLFAFSCAFLLPQ
jgi:hypothetical protein